MTETKNEFAVVGSDWVDGVADDMLGAGLVEISSLADFEARLAPPKGA